jgi:hypothetical protein
MRFIGLFAIVALLVLPAFTGCKEAKEDMDEYSNAIMTLPDRAKVISDLTRIRKALELYKIDSDGRYPDSIGELNLDKLYYSDEYEYDSSTGKVHSREYPTL